MQPRSPRPGPSQLLANSSNLPASAAALSGFIGFVIFDCVASPCAQCMPRKRGCEGIPALWDAPDELCAPSHQSH